MSNYLLFYTGTGTGMYDRVWIDKWCGTYDVWPVIIDPENQYIKKQSPPYFFKSIEEALAHPDLSGLSVYILDHRAEQRWNEITLPTTGAIYCIGHDNNGFYGYEGTGTKIKVAHPNTTMQDGEWFATMVAPLLLFEIYH